MISRQRPSQNFYANTHFVVGSCQSAFIENIGYLTHRDVQMFVHATSGKEAQRDEFACVPCILPCIRTPQVQRLRLVPTFDFVARSFCQKGATGELAKRGRSVDRIEHTAIHRDIDTRELTRSTDAGHG